MPCDPEFFAVLRKIHRIRQFAMDQRKRSDLALGALLRQSFGWSKQLPTDERNAIAEKVSEIISIGEKLLKWQERMSQKPESKARQPEGTDDPDFVEWQNIIMAAMRGRLPMAQTEDAAKARMEELAGNLPVADWFKANVFKGSLVSLAVLIAETGDLSGYATISKVWKRMGVAVMDGVRQGGLTKNSPKAAWIAHGYVKRRRSQLFVIGESLIKQNAHYRGICQAEKLRQRRIEEAKGIKVVPAAKIPKGKEKDFMSDGHVQNRARRYMEKRLLLDLWVAWQEANGKVIPKELLLPAQPIAKAA